MVMATDFTIGRGLTSAPVPIQGAGDFILRTPPGQGAPTAGMPHAGAPVAPPHRVGSPFAAAAGMAGPMGDWARAMGGLQPYQGDPGFMNHTLAAIMQLSGTGNANQGVANALNQSAGSNAANLINTYGGWSYDPYHQAAEALNAGKTPEQVWADINQAGQMYGNAATWVGDLNLDKIKAIQATMGQYGVGAAPQQQQSPQYNQQPAYPVTSDPQQQQGQQAPVTFDPFPQQQGGQNNNNAWAAFGQQQGGQSQGGSPNPWGNNDWMNYGDWGNAGTAYNAGGGTPQRATYQQGFY